MALPTSEGTRSSILEPALVVGFGAAVTVWVTWFVTHLPWLGIDERTALLSILGAWLIGQTLLLRAFRQTRPVVGIASGLIATLPGLMLVGSKLSSPASPDAAGAASQTEVVPAAPLIVIGFLAFGAILGLVSGLLARLSSSRAVGEAPERGSWLARFALVTCAAIVPLLLVGGLVTSTNSGMAVPDWPNTYGTNMLLYPLGPRVQAAMGKDYAGVYIEHSHRLFGMLVGMTTLVFAAWTLAREGRVWVKVMAAGAFVFVCVQGLLGGLRVTETSRVLALVHGFAAYLILGLVVATAVVLSPAFRNSATALGPAASAIPARRLRMLAAGLLHSMLLQLLLGAAYRQLRSDHVLYTHIAVSLVVMVFALMAAISAGAAAPNAGALRPTFARLSVGLLAVSVIQFLLGWVAFLFGGSAHQPDTGGQVIARTLHQGNGAFMFALAVALFVWTRRLWADLAGRAAPTGGEPRPA